MSLDFLPTHILVSAQIRTAAQKGVTITVLRKGDPMNGSILLKINHLNGQAEVLCQIYMDEQRVWTPAHSPSLIPDKEADAFVFQEGEKDPDLWLIEVEDKQGHSWFPGKIIDL